MTTAVIAEAGAASRATLRRRILAHCPEILVIGEAKDAAETISLVRSLQPGLLFLDTEMPPMPGFSLLGLTDCRDFGIIYTTDHEQVTSVRSGQALPVWLVKPFGVNALTGAVQEALRKRPVGRTDSAQPLLTAKTTSQRLALPSVNGLQFLEVRDILYLEANSNYTVLHLTSRTSVLVSKSLKEFEDILPGFFIRIHHSCIINKNLVSKYIRGEGGQVQMKNGTLLAVARRKKDEFLREMSLS